MFTTIQPHQTAQNKDLLVKAMKLRKQVFADQLNWDVPVHGDLEYDIYDTMGASYVVWCSEDRETMYGMVRLMVTTGPTLVHDVFHATHDNNSDLIADDVWEGPVTGNGYGPAHTPIAILGAGASAVAEPCLPDHSKPQNVLCAGLDLTGVAFAAVVSRIAEDVA